MKPFIVIIVFFVLASHQVVLAGDAERIRQLENEIKALAQASTDQDAKIQALEKRVGSREGEFAQQPSSPAAVGMTDDGQRADQSINPENSANQK